MCISFMLQVAFSKLKSKTQKTVVKLMSYAYTNTFEILCKFLAKCVFKTVLKSIANTSTAIKTWGQVRVRVNHSYDAMYCILVGDSIQ